MVENEFDPQSAMVMAMTTTTKRKRLESKRRRMISIAARKTQFEFWGFLFVMLAAVMSGFQWCMTRILLQVAMHDMVVKYGGEFVDTFLIGKGLDNDGARWDSCRSILARL